MHRVARHNYLTVSLVQTYMQVCVIIAEITRCENPCYNIIVLGCRHRVGTLEFILGAEGHSDGCVLGIAIGIVHDDVGVSGGTCTCKMCVYREVESRACSTFCTQVMRTCVSGSLDGISKYSVEAGTLYTSWKVKYRKLVNIANVTKRMVGEFAQNGNGIYHDIIRINLDCRCL